MGHIRSIFKPGASISQGFATVVVTTAGGTVWSGFVTSESADALELRDIAGNAHTIKVSDIKSRQELEQVL